MEKLKLGLVNMMPKAQEYADTIRCALLREIDLVEVYPIRPRLLAQRRGGACPGSHFFLDDLIERVSLDLLVVTGAPVEHLPYEQIDFWSELQEVLAFAESRSIAVFGICFGGLAIAKYLGIDKRILSDKLFGVHGARVSSEAECYVGPSRTHLCLPMSTFALLDETQIARSSPGPLKSLAVHPQMGHLMLSTVDDRFVMMLGHPEYTVKTLHDEWVRDLDRDIPYTRRYSAEDFTDMAEKLESAGVPILSNWVRKYAGRALGAESQAYPI